MKKLPLNLDNKVFKLLKDKLAPVAETEFDARTIAGFALGTFATFVTVFALAALFLMKQPDQSTSTTYLMMPKTASVKQIEKAKGVVAVIIEGVGLKKSIVDALSSNAAYPLSIAISPYAPDPAAVVGRLQRFGYEIWLDGAFAAQDNGIDAGPLSMSPTLTADDNLAIYARQRGPLKAFMRGVVVPPASALPYVTELWEPVAIKILSDETLVVDATSASLPPTLFLDNTQGNKTSAYMRPDVLINGQDGLASLKTKLATALSIAGTQHRALVLVSTPNKQVLAALSDTLKDFETKGILTVPASFLMSGGVTKKQPRMDAKNVSY